MQQIVRVVTSYGISDLADKIEALPKMLIKNEGWLSARVESFQIVQDGVNGLHAIVLLRVQNWTEVKHTQGGIK